MELLQVYHVGTTIAGEYQVLAIRGQGSFGVVYECFHLSTQERVAIKQSKLQIEVEGLSPTALREITILTQLQHENILKLKRPPLFMDSNLFLVTELLDTDLKNFIQTSNLGNIPPQQIKSIIFQLVSAIHCCHSHKIIHRDIKPGNILLSQEGNLKLADFGLARYITYPAKPLTEEVVTLYYRAPEILKGAKDYSLPIDIWSIGCVFAELLLGDVLFKGETQMSQLDIIIQTMGTPTLQQWPDFFENIEMQEEKVYDDTLFTEKLNKTSLGNHGRDLLTRFLVLNPKKRITALEALNHPYFNS